MPRPQITSAPATISYGATFNVGHAGSTPPAEVALVGLGSMTHCIDMNQRHVQLAVTPGMAGTVTVTAPSDPRVAPAGYYMLFTLAADRTPSIATIVRLLE